MTSYVYLGWGTTDSTGKAKLDHDANGDPLSHSYTGVGAGELDVLASLDNPVVEGSVVSQPYPVEDCLFYDKGILGDSDTHTSQWVTTGCTIEAQSDGTLITASAFSTCWANKVGTSSSEFDYTGDVAVEFDIISNTDVSKVQFQFYDGTNLIVGYLDNTLLGHYKIVLNGNKATPYIDGVQQTDWTGTAMSSAFRVGFRVHQGYTLKFKNFKIYPV